LYAYTAGGAWAALIDGLTAGLIPGLVGGLVVFDGDIRALAYDSLGAMGIALTV